MISKPTFFFIVFVAIMTFIFLIVYFGVQPEPSTARNDQKKDDSSIYGGIEIGSTGARYCIVKLAGNKNQNMIYKIIEDEPSFDTGDIRFVFDSTDNSIRLENFFSYTNEIKDKIQTILDSVRDTSKVFIVVGSTYEDRSNSLSFRTRFKDKFPMYKKQIEFLDSKNEGLSNFLTVIPSLHPYEDRLVIDIGSMEIKFTITTPQKPIQSRTHLWREGSKTLAEKIRKPTSVDSNYYKNIVSSFINENIPDIPPLFKSKKAIYLTGGAVYKIMQLLDKKTTDNVTNLSRRNLKLATNSLNNMGDTATIHKLETSTQHMMNVNIEIVRWILDKFETDSVYFYERKSWIPGYVLLKNNPKGN